MSENRGPRFPQIISYDRVPKNLLINAGFEIWQRGAGPFVGSGVFSADEWRTTANHTVSRSSSPLFGTYCAAVTATGGGMAQGIENYLSLMDRWVTFSVWVQCSTANAVRVLVFDWTGVSDLVLSDYHPGDGQWHQLTAVKKVRTGLVADAGRPHSFGLSVHTGVDASCTYLIDGASLVAGKFPEGVPFVPADPALDQKACERFYQLSGQAFANGAFFMGDVTSGGIYYAGNTYPTEMQATPTVTLTHRSASNFPAAAGVVTAKQRGYGEYRTASGTGRGQFSSDWTAEVT